MFFPFVSEIDFVQSNKEGSRFAQACRFVVLSEFAWDKLTEEPDTMPISQQPLLFR